MKKIVNAFASFACLLACASAQATVYEFDFAVSGFGPGLFSSTTAPQNAINGSIIFTANTAGAPVSSIDAVNLTINGHAYTPAELGSGVYGDGYYFGALVNGAGVTNYADNDFYVIFSNNYKVLAYAVENGYDTWTSRSVTGSITPQVAAVPEPGSLALLAAGVFGLGALRRRHTA